MAGKKARVCRATPSLRISQLLEVSLRFSFPYEIIFSFLDGIISYIEKYAIL
jgi:hypothetical protein